MTLWLLDHLLERIVRTGTLTRVWVDGRRRGFGDDTGPEVVMAVHDRRLPWRLLLNPSLALGDAYMDGTVTLPSADIRQLLDLLCRNLGTGSAPWAVNRLARAARFVARRAAQHNPAHRAADRVAHHYDLPDRLYDLFLDADRQYSAAYFLSGDDDLDTAQAQKKRHIAAKLCLAPGQRVLDIGCGWGGLALHLAQHQGDASVIGITLSREQLRIATARAERAGLAQRVDFQYRDYRHLQGRFERVVSVGMFEHVGVTHYRAFFRRLHDLLSDDGVALLHTIGRSDGPGATDPWIRKYIFPGGYIPALSEILPHIEDSGLIVTDIEVLRLHYAQTLAHWLARFQANRAQFDAVHDARFQRMWEFYLAGSEMAFRHGGMVVFQIQMARRQDAVPLVRDYITETERRHPLPPPVTPPSRF
ncbi:SAM-dependent methyltransferase [Roseospirillum parvum]|uniref:Cyclopropane-fatty-acyl-phospholipid synthase n=1 Tax=Roseospirillum parvum TaxID=83401 RepID=A0A1G8BK16_9PROT|nr:cyclopropane-fatty-acyl-phospholipid synthase family protein [Roseospirillum parvum]SDH33501.1 cyclopropane-fatty-acyl-phospholipid synthase [Roseospirillum parvum]